jgi:hypothetical protein
VSKGRQVQAEVLPRFCTCLTPTWGRSPRTGFWTCDKCGCPREVWWRTHKARLDRLESKGLCTQGASSSGFRQHKCKNMIKRGGSGA